MANGYDMICEAAKASRTIRMPEAATIPGTPVRPHSAYSEASGSKRSDGKSSQTKDGGNRYDTSTPEKRRKALAAARRSDNPEDLKRLRGKVAESCLLPPIYPREAVSSGDFPQMEEAPLHVLFYEVYDSRAAFDAHLQTPHLARFREGFPALVLEERFVRLASRHHG